MDVEIDIQCGRAYRATAEGPSNAYLKIKRVVGHTRLLEPIFQLAIYSRAAPTAREAIVAACEAASVGLRKEDALAPDRHAKTLTAICEAQAAALARL